jgi:dolichyl-phosphate beta-glucosyltransferase
MSRCIMVVPCYNEESRLAPEEFRAFLDLDSQVQFYLVDDGSTDGTAELLRALARESSGRIRFIQLPHNVGKGEAVRQGMLAAFDESCEYAGYWDADLATPLAAIPDFYRTLDARPQVELILGCRVPLPGHRVARQPARRFAGRAAAMAASWILGMSVRDTQCGAKLFRHTPRTRQVFQQPFLSRWIFDIEVLERLIRLTRAEPDADVRAFMCEYPLETWREKPGSHLRWRDYARAGYDLTRLACSRWTSRRGSR